jgi:hypothetical protein
MSLARAQEAQVKTMENLLSVVNNQLDRFARQNEALSSSWEKMLEKQMVQNASLLDSMMQRREILEEEIQERGNVQLGIDPELKEMIGIMLEKVGGPIIEKLMEKKIPTLKEVK